MFLNEVVWARLPSGRPGSFVLFDAIGPKRLQKKATLIEWLLVFEAPPGSMGPQRLIG
jgi:hypothetical protein